MNLILSGMIVMPIVEKEKGTVLIIKQRGFSEGQRKEIGNQTENRSVPHFTGGDSGKKP